jgi:hypothetical protein
MTRHPRLVGRSGRQAGKKKKEPPSNGWFWADLKQAAVSDIIKSIRRITEVSKLTSGEVCFVCESDEGMEEFEENSTGTCPNCSPVVTIDAKQGQRLLAHIGAHILHDPKVDRLSKPCGLCLRPSPMCQFFLKKGKGANGNITLNTTLSKGCPNMIKFSYGVAGKSSESSPCSNVPIPCPLCSKGEPGIWRYNMKYHIMALHPLAQLSRYEDLWTISNFEKTEMKHIWHARQKVPVKRPANHLPMATSKAHTSRLAFR